MKHWLVACALASATAGQAGPPEWVAARVLKVERERSRVTLDHARIDSIDMDAMVMPFKAEKTVDLRSFQPGDEVRFRVTVKNDHLVIEAMEKAR
jgi:Cu/Ag efflux protein CusF